MYIARIATPILADVVDLTSTVSTIDIYYVLYYLVL